MVLGIGGGSRTRTGAACRRPKGTVTEGQWSGRSGGAARVRAATLPALQRPTRGPDGRMVIRPFSHSAIQPSGHPAIRPADTTRPWSCPLDRPQQARRMWMRSCPPDGLFFLQRSRLLVSIWFLIECTAGAPAVGSDVGDSLTTLCRRKREILPRTPAHVALGCAGRIRGVFITSPIHLWKCVGIRRPACRHDHVLSSANFLGLGSPDADACLSRRRRPALSPQRYSEVGTWRC